MHSVHPNGCTTPSVRAEIARSLEPSGVLARRFGVSDAVCRILKAEGLNRLPSARQRRRKSGTFKDCDLGFLLMDIKHLPKAANAPSTWPSTGPRAGCIWPSSTTSCPAAPSPSPGGDQRGPLPDHPRSH